MNYLLDHDHAALEIVLEEVFSALADGAVERSIERLDVFWARLAVHIRAENVQLFPALLRASESLPRRADAPSRQEISDTIARLRNDHDFFMSELTSAVKELRSRQRGELGDLRDEPPTPGRVRERLAHVNERLKSHNALEESRVYLWVSALLDEPKQKLLSETIQRELENLPPRLKKP